MIGRHNVIIQNKWIHYEFTIVRNLTIITGESATGKTQLIQMIMAYGQRGQDSGIELICDKKCTVLTSERWEESLSLIHDSLVFIEEGNRFVASEDFASAVRKTDNYYIIVTRDSLPNLPYSIEEIYGIRLSGKYAGLKKTYNELFRIYGNRIPHNLQKPGIVITEDSNAGFEFFSSVYREMNLSCISAGGKTKLAAYARKTNSASILIIGDGSAIGSEADALFQLTEDRENITLYFPESFEWLILRANPMDDKEIREILDSPESHIYSEQFFSWEQFFTKVLTEKTAGTYLQYSKSKLNSNYLIGRVKEEIKNCLPKAVLEFIEESPDI